MAKLKLTYITKVEEENDGEKAITMDIKRIHRLNLLPLRQLILFILQVLVRDHTRETRHTHSTANEMNHHKAQTCHYPLKKERAEGEPSWPAKADQKGT